MATLLRTVVRPVVTEKSSAAYGALKEYAFECHPDATKPQIRAAIESLFGVTVTSVRTMQQRSKRKTRSQREGRRPRWKKALIRLKDGDSLPVFEG